MKKALTIFSLHPWPSRAVVQAVAATLLCVLLGLNPPAHAAPETTAAEAKGPAIVHLLDYVGVDYPSTVKDGKVVDAAKYAE